jgi:hypothetical protein
MPTISSVVAARPIGQSADINGTSGESAGTISVITVPGQTAFTRIPLAASSNAATCVKLITAALEAL